MGAPKLKWTAEEEAALKAGVIKHGAGKWRTILRDPEFNDVLISRSNVDLKDKWRNLAVTANGFGSREKARVALKKSRKVYLHDSNPLAVSEVVEDMEDDTVHVKPISVHHENVQTTSRKRPISSRLDGMILEAITKLKEPTGSSKTAIAMYAEDNYWPYRDLEHLLSTKLKSMTASGRLIKVNCRYRIAPTSVSPERKTSKLLALEGRKKESSRTEKEDCRPLSLYQVDAELAQMRNMTAEEAAAAAAQAVAEAEAAMAEAEEAAREAEAAEADAEAAQAFAEAAMLTYKSRNLAKPVLFQSVNAAS